MYYWEGMVLYFILLGVVLCEIKFLNFIDTDMEVDGEISLENKFTFS